MPFVDPENDPGSLTLALLASSTVHNLAACRQWMTMREFIELWSKVHNSKATIKTGPMTTAPPEFLEEINDIVDFQVEYGYYGHAVDDTLVDPPSVSSFDYTHGLYYCRSCLTTLCSSYIHQ